MAIDIKAAIDSIPNREGWLRVWKIAAVLWVVVVGTIRLWPEPTPEPVSTPSYMFPPLNMSGSLSIQEERERQTIAFLTEAGIMLCGEPARKRHDFLRLPPVGSGIAIAYQGDRRATRPPRSRKILVIDDEADIADVLVIGLGRLGYQVTAIGDPAAALMAFTQSPDAFDVVISDQVMPGMKGMLLFARMRAIKPALRFILCTGFSDAATEKHALDSGVDGFFIKPVSPEQVAASIREIITGER